MNHFYASCVALKFRIQSFNISIRHFYQGCHAIHYFPCILNIIQQYVHITSNTNLSSNSPLIDFMYSLLNLYKALLTFALNRKLYIELMQMKQYNEPLQPKLVNNVIFATAMDSQCCIKSNLLISILRSWAYELALSPVYGYTFESFRFGKSLQKVSKGTIVILEQPKPKTSPLKFPGKK